jgi:hypothetical protein
MTIEGEVQNQSQGLRAGGEVVITVRNVSSGSTQQVTTTLLLSATLPMSRNFFLVDTNLSVNEYAVESLVVRGSQKNDEETYVQLESIVSTIGDYRANGAIRNQTTDKVSNVQYVLWGPEGYTCGIFLYRPAGELTTGQVISFSEQYRYCFGGAIPLPDQRPSILAIARK